MTIEQNSSPANQWKLGADDLWFSSGYQGKGPYRFNGESLYYYEFPKSPHEDNFAEKYSNASHSPYGIYSIYKDSKGHLWFGTSEMGIYKFDGEIISYIYEKKLTETPNGGAFGIRSIAEDYSGYFWINNSDYKYEVLQDSIPGKDLVQMRYNRLPGIKTTENQTQYYLSIAADDNGNLWMLTYDNGVWKNDGNELNHYPVKDANKDLKLSALYKDKQGRLWLGTQNAKVFKFNGKSFEKLAF